MFDRSDELSDYYFILNKEVFPFNGNYEQISRIRNSAMKTFYSDKSTIHLKSKSISKKVKMKDYVDIKKGLSQYFPEVKSRNKSTIGVEDRKEEHLSLIHICRCRRYAVCRSRWSPYH
eukprot:TRINITY_DN23048_c0_g1_i1.p1 TRINITY_DN23048_c0_g1~~TRINITY_DN23048_c0_g1_i1.p1  ORF type:complete len:118 (+),score=28.87 TRINITY_DN23048_c0_g1_i1:402-755(+)